MAITLGEIAVRLTANTAEFISGFGAAGQSAKRFRADLSEQVSAVGGVLERGLAQFGEFGESVGGILGNAASTAGQAIASFGKLGGSMGTIVGVGAGVAAGLAVAEAGIIGIAIHAAESAAQLGEMSEKAGVSSRTMAGLAFAGHGVGVESESLVKALGFMGANAVKSAIAADYSKTAFGRLGIQVRDTSGQVKEGGQLFLEAIGKISSLPTSEQGYFVKQIFGRGGIEILPLINKGIDGVREKMELAGQLGLGDPQTVAAARQFKETVDEIKAAFEGIALRLAADLLPALNEIVKEIGAGFRSGALKEFIDDLAYIVRLTLAAGAAIANLAKAAATLSPVGVMKAANEAEQATYNKGLGAGWQAIKDYYGRIGSSLSGVFTSPKDIMSAQLPPAPATKPGTFQPDLTPVKEDTTLARIKERLAMLMEEQANWASTAAAASEAETLIAKAVQKGNEAFRKETEFAARDKTGAAQKFVAQHEAQIKAAAASVFYDQTIVKTNEDLDKEADTLTQTDIATQGLAAAYAKGGAAIASAALDKQFAKEAAAIAELAGVRDVAALKAKLERNEALARKVASDELTVSLARETSESAALSPAINNLNDAYLRGEDAVRRARIELELQRFAQVELAKGIVVTAQQIEAKRDVLSTADKQAYDAALAQEAAQFSLNAQYQNTIVRLERIREVMQSQGVSTLGVEAQIFDEQNRLLHQWDEWAFKVGTLGQRFKAVMGELVIQGRNAGAAISQAILQAVDGIESGLAKLLTGQKADFKAVFQNLAESVTKAKIQEGVGKLAEHFGLKIPGLGPKADGSEGSPFYVILKGGAGAFSPLAAGTTNNIPLFGSFAGSSANAGESQGGIGGFFSSLFGGFRASGGDMSPGKWYIAGERGPEIVAGPGSVIPNHALGGPTYNITHNHNYPNAASRDLFGFTQRQNQARQARNMKMAYGF